VFAPVLALKDNEMLADGLEPPIVDVVIPENAPIASTAFQSLEAGTGLSWEYDSATGRLTINYDENSGGNGIIPNYEILNQTPWSTFRSNVTSVVLDNGVTVIGKLSLAHFEKLPEITIPSSVTSIKTMGLQAEPLWRKSLLKPKTPLRSRLVNKH
jgi:hypothetical protein